jgi:hypothetical protein
MGVDTRRAFRFYSIFIFSAKPSFSTKAGNNAKDRKGGELAFSSSSTLCKTMVSRICKTMGIMTECHVPEFGFLCSFLSHASAQWGQFINLHSSFHQYDEMSLPELWQLCQDRVSVLTEPRPANAWGNRKAPIRREGITISKARWQVLPSPPLPR